MKIKLTDKLPQLVFQTDTMYAHYQVWDIVYDGRPARVLYSGNRQTAQSGIAVDDKSDLLFDYNQRLYELVSGVLPKRLLLIGGGMYTLPLALLAALPLLIIDVVEIDEQLDDIAEAFFGLEPDPRLTIIHQAGRSYLDKTKQQYDMIIVDAFSQAETPTNLTDEAAAGALRRCLRPGGLVAVNCIATYFGRNADNLKHRMHALTTHLPETSIYPASYGLSLWLPQNLLLIAQNDSRLTLDKFMRYQVISAED